MNQLSFLLQCTFKPSDYVQENGLFAVKMTLIFDSLVIVSFLLFKKGEVGLNPESSSGNTMQLEFLKKYYLNMASIFLHLFYSYVLR